MGYSPILVPVIALVGWTLLVMLWMGVARFSEFRRLGINLSKIPNGARGVDLEGHADPRAIWKSHNYSHLMEQPTIFYAICLALALMDRGDGVNHWLAWGYVGFRVLHSLVQCTVNIVAYRFALFSLASLCLIGLTVHAAAALIHDAFG